MPGQSNTPLDCKTVRSFAYSSARERSKKVWSEAENGEWDLGGTLKVLFLSPHSLLRVCEVRELLAFKILKFWEKNPAVLQYNTPFFCLIYPNNRDLIPLGLVHPAVKRALEGLTQMGVGIKSSPGSKWSFLIPASYFVLVVSGNEKVTLPAESTLRWPLFPSQECSHILLLSPLWPSWPVSWAVYGEKLALLEEWPYHHKRVTRIGGSPF